MIRTVIGIYVRIVAFMVAAAMLTACVSDSDGPDWALAAGDSLPGEFSVVMHDGTEWTTASLRGRMAVIVFFNTGCPDCRKELPELQKVFDIYNRGEDDGEKAVFMCIARAEDEASIANFWTENDLTLPYSPQPDRHLYNMFAGSRIPRIFIVDADGVIRATFSDDPLPTASEILRALD